MWFNEKQQTSMRCWREQKKGGIDKWNELHWSIEVRLGQHPTENAWRKTKNKNQNSQKKNSHMNRARIRSSLNWIDLNWIHTEPPRTPNESDESWFMAMCADCCFTIPKNWNRSERAYMQNTTCNTNFRWQSSKAKSIKSFHLLRKWNVQRSVFSLLPSRLHFGTSVLCLSVSQFVHFLLCCCSPLTFVSFASSHSTGLTLAFGI